MDERGIEPQLVPQPLRAGDRVRREIHPGHDRAVASPGQRVGPDVALQVEHPFAPHVAELAQFDLVEDLVAVPQELDFLVRVNVDERLLVPPGAVRLLGLAMVCPLGHGLLLSLNARKCAARSRKGRASSAVAQSRLAL